MLATTESVAIVGTEAFPVRVEMHVGTGLPTVKIVGLPARSVQEAEQRTKSALTSSGESWPSARTVANLAPGALRKEGTHFDLALAIAVLGATDRLTTETLEGWVFMGELGLDGRVRAVRGLLAAAMMCRSTGRRGVICPRGNALEAKIVEGIEVVPVESLGECIAYLSGDFDPPAVLEDEETSLVAREDMDEVRGHAKAKEALTLAAAGGHNVLLAGPPGSGKTMLARRLPGILPQMTLDEAFEVTRIHSVAGLLGEHASLIRSRPFRVPHHHVSLAGLIGGGSGLARPGEVTLAHNGVLFLDEISLYARQVLESLRAPLEDGAVRIARSGGVVSYPCRFSLVAAMNPCACGYRGDPKRPCRCSEQQCVAYETRLSGPLLDRFDMKIDMERLTKDQLLGPPDGEPSDVIRERVERARALQAQRYGSSLITNASASKRQIEASVGLSSAARKLLGDALDGMGLTGRGVDRVLRVARSVADLGGSEDVTDEHVGIALGFRLMPAGMAA